jgi:hypothetical protein
MANRIALVSCVKKKRNGSWPARDLYLSPLFRGLRCYAERHSDAWYILSAKHFVLPPDKVVKRYERSLNDMNSDIRRKWADCVNLRLLELLPPRAEITLLAGMMYRKDIHPFLEKHGFVVEIPLQGLGIGKQLRYLKKAACL